MVLEVLPDSRKIDLGFDANLSEKFGVTNARYLQDLRRMDCTCGKDNFLVC